MSLLGRLWVWGVGGLLGAVCAAGVAQAHECGCGYGRHAAAYAGRYEHVGRVRRVVTYRYVRTPVVRYVHTHAVRYLRAPVDDYARGPAVEEQHYGYLDEAADQGFAYQPPPRPQAPPPVERYSGRSYDEQGYGERGYGERGYGEQAYGDALPPSPEQGDYAQRGAVVRSWSSERDSSRYYAEANGYERGGVVERRTVCDEFCRTHTYVRGDVWPRPPEEEADIGVASVPDTFFIATGGVGPEVIDSGGGGGGVTIVNGGGFGFGGGSGMASANASASASASASARIMSSIVIGGMLHYGGGGMRGWGGGGMSHGCGCSGGGHKW